MRPVAGLSGKYALRSALRAYRWDPVLRKCNGRCLERCNGPGTDPVTLRVIAGLDPHYL